ncbi:MAG: acetyl-CoA C-acyltransferase [Proteobacteria bacterium]|nr:MAG: acetyl-CoA C-acyltransferase [Pseudomonadota bacterium]
MKTNQTVIAYASRTAVGKMNGSLATTPAPRLGAALVEDALKKLNLKGEEVDEIIMGQVLTAGVGQAPARQTAIYGGLPPSVSATTLGKVCGSGMKAVMLADQAIRLGDAQIVFAGGQENMSLAPHVMPNSRTGYRFGSFEVKDSMQYDGLWDPYNNMPMGSCGELCAKDYNFTRELQDEYTFQSYTKARKAVESGVFGDEIVAFAVQDKKGTKNFEIDEEPFSVDLDRIGTLRPAFAKDGTITAANASSINDGAALLVLASEDAALKNGLKPIARILSQASHAQDPKLFTTAPIECIKKALKKANLKVSDIDLFEINEAFAVVSMAAIKDLSLNPERVNVNGGAVAIGHPIGASGARILVTLIHALKQRKEKRGLAAICIGGGEATAMIIELV